jgi:hypothetical protein
VAWLLGSFALVPVSALTGGTTASAAIGYAYEASAVARSDVQVSEFRTGDLAQVDAGSERSIAPLSAAAGTRTTPAGSRVATEDGERTYDWRKLGYREFENFFGESAEDVKKDIVGSGGSKFDLYEDKCTGEIFVLRKGGVGEPQPTGYRFPK